MQDQHEYVELHCHSNYSFQEGASSLDELLLRARELGYPALALTDHDNLCGAMQFAQTARSLDVRPIIGAEVTLTGGQHLTLLAATRKGYGNLCRLLSYSRITTDRREPELDPRFLPEHAEGLVLLTGCRKGPVPSLVEEGRFDAAMRQLRQYVEWFGAGNVFVELQYNLAYGDTRRVRGLIGLAKEAGLEVVATNNVHYHVRDRHRLQDCLVAIKCCKSLEESHRERRPNSEFYLKSGDEMAAIFRACPEAVADTLRVAERCAFDLSRDLGYRFPDYPVPPGYTPDSYLARLCADAAVRRYGSVTPKVKARLDEELRLIRKHNLAGFLLLYHEIIQIAREVMVDLGLSDLETPLEEDPPGRGRGSSVAMLAGYLIGLSHIDPLEYDLPLERFLPEDALYKVPDIDLDFPRNIREALIKRVHERYGWDHAALTGMIDTYQIKGAVRDLGKALALPPEEVDRLAKRVEHRSAKDLEEEMLALPEFKERTDAHGWRELVELAAQLDGFPRYLAQHPGGMIVSSSPLVEMVPVQPGAIEGRYIVHWDKDAIEDAGFVKIDFLALGALSQLQEALREIEKRRGTRLDLSRIDFNDKEVYAMLHRADTIGVFQVESAAQIQTITRLKPRNLTDMAHEVGAVRPGVGVNDGVRKYIRRKLGLEPVRFDHPLEKRALARTRGVILFQDQVNQLAIDVAGFLPSEADRLRRAFKRHTDPRVIEHWWGKFRDGAKSRGVSEEVARGIFQKFNGEYMFPESHAFAFGVTAYQLAWLKRYYPVEFYLGLFNQQPMGFYSLETLKEDARRHGVPVLNPDVNASQEKCVIEDRGPHPAFDYRSGHLPPRGEGTNSSPPLGESQREGAGGHTPHSYRPLTSQGLALRLGFLHVESVGEAGAKRIMEARTAGGPFRSLREFMERVGLLRESVEALVDAGAFDSLSADRRALRWEVGLRYRPKSPQLVLPMPVEQDMARLSPLSEWGKMKGEYARMGLYPSGHVMALLRPGLGKDVSTSEEVADLPDGAKVTVAGLVIRRQRPLGRAVFLTLEDEFGHTPLVAWPDAYAKHRLALKEPLVKVWGLVSRREGTMNVVVEDVEPLDAAPELPKSRDFR